MTKTELLSFLLSTVPKCVQNVSRGNSKQFPERSRELQSGRQAAPKVLDADIHDPPCRAPNRHRGGFETVVTGNGVRKPAPATKCKYPATIQSRKEELAVGKTYLKAALSSSHGKSSNMTCPTSPPGAAFLPPPLESRFLPTKTICSSSESTLSSDPPTSSAAADAEARSTATPRSTMNRRTGSSSTRSQPLTAGVRLAVARRSRGTRPAPVLPAPVLRRDEKAALRSSTRSRRPLSQNWASW